MYINWTNSKDLNTNNKLITDSVTAYGSIANTDRGSRNLGSNTIRSTFNRSDYDYNRYGENKPRSIPASIAQCDNAYINISIVRSVIDMMADFTVAGIRIEHRNPKIQNILDDWIKLVNFDHISERISNNLYRIGNAPVHITYGKVPMSTERDWGKTSADLELIKPSVQSKRIPMKYSVLHPNSLEVIGGELTTFIGEPIYGLRSTVSQSGIKKIQDLKNKLDKSDIKFKINIPTDNTIIINGISMIPLNKENLQVLFYKKDDWLTWAWPMMHSILDPLYRLEKMHLADDKALDGAISQVRLWTIGNFEHKIFATAAAINKLRDTLANIGSGDVMDVIWGPELTFKESEPKGYNFLKSEKYDQVMTEIYAGLGVPSALTGAGSNEGFSNNSISMKAMIERLEYGRKVLKSFWEEQLKILQLAFKWKYPAIVSFDHQVMTDETLERKILMDLFDRNVISIKKLRQLCRQDPILEDLRVRSEQSRIKNGKIPDKAGPYHNANLENDLKKIILQGGGVAPSEMGIELEDKKKGEKSLKEIDAKLTPKPISTTPQQSKLKGTPGQGRPTGVKDSIKRKRTEKPRQARADLQCPECQGSNIDYNSDNNYCSDCENRWQSNITSFAFVEIFNWANSAQEDINKILTPFFLHYTKKKNLRLLTKAETQEFEKLKLSVLCNIEPHQILDKANIQDKLSGEIDNDVLYYMNSFVKIFNENNDREPTLTEMRQIQSSAIALKYESN